MDRNLHTDDFERLLREKSDEFRMYPSKRIWYSVYNNIHPGSRWPSVVMSIVLISSLLLVGYLNTSDANKTSNINTSGNQRSLSILALASIPYYLQPFSTYNGVSLTDKPQTSTISKDDAYVVQN